MPNLKSMFVALLVAIVVSACNSDIEFGATPRSPWLGRSVDELFRAYGPPKSEKPVKDGGKLFTWEAVQNSAYMAGWSTTDKVGSTGICRIHIATDKFGLIVAVVPAGSMMEAEVKTKCREIVGPQQ